MPTPRNEFSGGVRATLPLLAGDLPFGVIYSVQGAAAGVPPLVTLAMSSIVFAGSAQFIAISQLGAVPPVPYPIMVLTTFVVNLRHLLYTPPSALPAPPAAPLEVAARLPAHR